MRQYFLILADAELELVPKRIVRERCVLNSARARNKIPEKMLLDASHHHPAFGKLPDGDRRGRPDLVHMFLLLSLDSDATAEGKLRIFVHTRNNDVVAVNPETRLPPNYIRFVGLIEQLFEQQVVPSRENALLELRHEVPLDVLVNALKPDSVIVLDPAGEKADLHEEVASADGERVVVIMGGFSKGTFTSDLRKVKAKHVSLGDRMMKVWTVTSKTLRALEFAEKSSAEPAPKKPAAAKKKPAARKASGARRARKKSEE
ncbi:TPA: 16S rRNA methyltransferase [Thermoplasmata archaeon]|nr:16S rRNA methyltransferase [Thermoplasmata archaeon]